MNSAELTFSGESLVLLLAEPDWNDAVEVEEECSADIATTRLGAEYRRPNRDKPVIGRIAYEAVLEAEDWQAWRGIQRLIDSRRVVCPIWPDVLPAAEWGTRVHESDLVAGWNEGFASPVLGTASALPDRTYLAPVCIGRLKLNSDEPLCGDLASVSVEVTHDAAFGEAATIETVLLLKVEDGVIVEKTGNGAVSILGSETIDADTESIRNTAAGSTTPTGICRVEMSLDFSADYTIEGWWMPLSISTELYVGRLWALFSAFGFFQLLPSGLYTSPENATVSHPAVGQWHHVCKQRRGGIVETYIDRVQVASGPDSAPGALHLPFIELGGY